MDSPVARAIRSLFFWGPLLFGFGFLAPLLAQILSANGVTTVFGLSPLMFGLLSGGALGLLAQVRGRWI